MTVVSAPPLDPIPARMASRPFFGRLAAIFRQPWFAYLAIFVLQLRVIWNIWQYKDLQSGDTSYYFVTAWNWFSTGKINLIMSPLYLIFYGSLFALSRDIYSVTILHRMVIVLLLAPGVLAVMRRLLPAGIAWLMAAWWVVLPINFAATFEVHLFAVLPILAIWLTAMIRNPGPWVRGAALALFVGTTILVRNEMIVPTGFFALICLHDEWRSRRGALQRPSLFSTAAAYLAPLLALGLLLGWLYSRSDSTDESIRAQLKNKHTLNMAQVYAFGYQQRHGDWVANPWVEFGGLCQRDFGDPQPSLGLMIRRNPRAVADHVLWNFRLLPSGLQLLLFDRAAGALNPDYVPVHLHSRIVNYWSAAAILILVTGVGLRWRERQRTGSSFGPRRLGWLAMICVAAVAPFIVATQRPRPEYLYGLGIPLMAWVGASVSMILQRLRMMGVLSALMPVIMVASPFIVPSYYSPALKDPRALLQLYERLRPFHALFDNPDAVVLTGEFAPEIQNYLGHGKGKTLQYKDVFRAWDHRQTLADLLDQNQINLCYLDRGALAELDRRHPGALRQFIDQGGQQGWRLVGWEQHAQTRWMLFQKRASGVGHATIMDAAAACAPLAPDSVEKKGECS